MSRLTSQWNIHEVKAVYDSITCGWFTPDPAEQFSNPYLGIGNNPVVYVDPDGEFVWLVPLIAGAVFGGINLGIQASNGNIDNFGDGITAFGAGFVAGAAISTGVMYGLGVPILGTVIKGAGIAYGVSAGAGTILGVGEGIATGDWSGLENTGKILAGNFYLDEDREFFGQVWQGISRFSWELPQTTIGHGYTQLKNSAGLVDRVDYFGGATFATSENRNVNQAITEGISLGNFINVNIEDEIEGDFKDRVLNDGVYMHEYGHTFDSQIMGSFYVPIMAMFSTSAGRDGWTEVRANNHAARYFGNRFGIDWADFEKQFPLK